MGYTAGSFTAGQQPTTAQWNVLWSNDASFNDGTGIAALGSGKLTASYSARVSRVGNQSIANNTFTKIQYNTEAFDVGNNYDNATNYVFTAPVAGYYLVHGTAEMAGALMQTAIDCYVNGSSVTSGHAMIQDNRQNTTNTPQYSDILHLSANDTVAFYIWHLFGSSASLTFGRAYFSFLYA